REMELLIQLKNGLTYEEIAANLHIFFFQAEDGIRDFHVTGVQTCALPIVAPARTSGDRARRAASNRSARRGADVANARRGEAKRSEERRVGKEGGGAAMRPPNEKKAQKRVQQPVTKKKGSEDFNRT